MWGHGLWFLLPEYYPSYFLIALIISFFIYNKIGNDIKKLIQFIRKKVGSTPKDDSDSNNY